MSRKSSDRTCGVHTCGVHTHVNASPVFRVSTRPRITLGLRHQSSFNRIPLDIPRDPMPFRFVSDVVVVRFPLPKRLSRSSEDAICFPCRCALQRLQQQTRVNSRQQKHVDMIRHHDPRPKLVMAEAFATKQRPNNYFGDRFLAQVQRPRMCAVQIPIHRSKHHSIHHLPRRWELRMWKTSVQAPGYEEPPIPRIDVRKMGVGHQRVSGVVEQKISRSHECERHKHECERHTYD